LPRKKAEPKEKEVKDVELSTAMDISEEEIFRLIYLAKIGLFESFNNFVKDYGTSFIFQGDEEAHPSRDQEESSGENASEQDESEKTTRDSNPALVVGPSYGFDEGLFDFVSNVLFDWTTDYAKIARLETMLQETIAKNAKK